MENTGYIPWYRLKTHSQPKSTEEMIGALESEMVESLEDFHEEN